MTFPNTFNSLSSATGKMLDDNFNYSVNYTPAGTGAVNTTVQDKLRESVSVKDFGAIGDGNSHPLSTRYATLAAAQAVYSFVTSLTQEIDWAAWQAAANHVGSGSITCPDGNYLFSDTLDLTSSSVLDRSGISFIAFGGRRGGVTITGNTSGWIIDLSGTAWSYFKGMYLICGSTHPSTGGILLGGTAAKPECLSNYFDNIFIQLYNPAAPVEYGTVGIAAIGSEENTFNGIQIFATTPTIFSTNYSTISTHYPSPYKTIQASHSCGVNTFSGENALVSLDKNNSNVYLYGVNSIDFGNMYFGNANFGTTGTHENCITVLGGTIDGMKGRIKIENKSVLLAIGTGELFDVDLKVSFGGGVSPSRGVIELPVPSAAQLYKYENIKCAVSYYDPANASFLGKYLVKAPGTSGGLGNEYPSIANWSISVNQTSTQNGNPYFPAQFCGVATNCKLEFTDCSYELNKHTHIKRMSGQMYLGVGSGTGSIIGKIYLPSITAGYSARSIEVRIAGIISSINETGGATETLVTNCYFNTAKGAYSINDGVIVVAANGGSDSLISTTTYIAISNNAGLALYTGVTLDMTYNSTPRTIDLTAIPKGTGASLGGALAFLNDIEIELYTSGRVQELIYIQ